MSEQEGFSSGFFLGTLVGGVIGGVIGAVAASRQKQSSSAKNFKETEDNSSQLDSEESIESARRSLEDKISQLNLAIDDVRQQLGANDANRTED